MEHAECGRMIILCVNSVKAHNILYYTCILYYTHYNRVIPDVGGK